MELARETWTDERLDDLVRHMDEGFARLDGRIDKEIGALGARIDRESDLRHTEMQELRSEINARFDAIDRRFDSLQRMMLIFYGGMVLTLVGTITALT